MLNDDINDFDADINCDTLENHNKDIINNVPRKRGRPRKNQTVSNIEPLTQNSCKQNNDEEREIVLHLAILSFNNTNTTSNGLTDTNMTTEDVNTSSETSQTSELYASPDEMMKKDNQIKKLQTEIQLMKNYISSSSTCDQTNIIPMNVKLINNTTGDDINISKTDIACWWCTYEFDNIPWFLPIKYFENKFFVCGCFCGPCCVAAYNINIDDFKVLERYSLLKQLYSSIVGNNNNIDIKIAPPKEVLVRYGGKYSIEEYRKNNNMYINSNYRLVLPPMVNYIACIEEKIRTVED